MILYYLFLYHTIVLYICYIVTGDRGPHAPEGEGREGRHRGLRHPRGQPGSGVSRGRRERKSSFRGHPPQHMFLLERRVFLGDIP